MTLELHPFEERLTVHVAEDIDAGGITPVEADTLITTIEVARDIANQYAAGPTPWD